MLTEFSELKLMFVDISQVFDNVVQLLFHTIESRLCCFLVYGLLYNFLLR